MLSCRGGVWQLETAYSEGGFWPLRLEITVGDCDAIGRFFDEELEGSDAVPEDKEYLLNE